MKGIEKCTCGAKPAMMCPLQTSIYDLMTFWIECPKCGLKTEPFHSSISARQAWSEMTEKMADDKKGRKKK